MITAVVREWNRVEQVYNISSEEYVTFDGMAKLCAQAAGMAEPQIVHYDPKSVEVPDGFPKAWDRKDRDPVGNH